MRKLLFLALAIILLPFFTKGIEGRTRSASTTASTTYHSPTPGHIPIVAWDPVLHGSTPTTSNIVQIKNCGFNCALHPYDWAQLKRLMSAMQNDTTFDGFSLIMSLEHYTKHNYAASYCENLISDLLSYMSSHNIDSTRLGGFMVMDEPTSGELGYVSSFHNMLRSASPHRLAMTNLPGSGHWVLNYNSPAREVPWSDNDTNRQAYDGYLSTYCNTSLPEMLSYDCYPFIRYIGNDSLDIRYQDFYYNLHIHASKSRSRGIPFWAFCQSCNVILDSEKEHPMATEAFLRFEAFNALAMGAQGISYWNYWPQENNNECVHDSSLVTKTGVPTSAYACARKINEEIRSWEHVFLGAELQSYSFAGDQYANHTDTSIYKINQQLRPLRATGKGALISLLKNGDRNYLVLVNQDPLHDSRVWMRYDATRYTFADMYTYNTNDTPVLRPTDPIIPGGIHLDQSRYRTFVVDLKPSKYWIIEY